MKFTDKELRNQIREEWNGEYAISICANCKRYITSPQGDVNKAVITKNCTECF